MLVTTKYKMLEIPILLNGLKNYRINACLAASFLLAQLISGCAAPTPETVVIADNKRIKIVDNERIKSVTIWPNTFTVDPKWYGNSHLVVSTSLCDGCSQKLAITPRDEFEPKVLSSQPPPPPPTGIGGKREWAAYWDSLPYGKPDIYDHKMVSFYGDQKIGIYDFKSKKITPVPNDLSIWTQPKFVSDGSRIAFAHRDNTGVIKIIIIDKAGSNSLILMDEFIIEDLRYFIGMATHTHGTTLVYTLSNKSEALLGEIDLRSRRHVILVKTNEKIGIEPTFLGQWDYLVCDPESVIPEGYTASPALDKPKYNKNGSKISYIRSIMGRSHCYPLVDPPIDYEWKTRQLFVYSKATGKIRPVTPHGSVILASDWYGDELYFIGSIGSQSGLWHANESGQIKQLLSFVTNKLFGYVEVSPNGKYITFSDISSRYPIYSGMVGIVHIKPSSRSVLW